MKKTLGNSEAVRLLMNDEYARWSREAAQAIVDHIEEIEESTEQEIEFDPVAIRCDFSEFESATEAASDYGWEFDGDDDGDDLAYKKVCSALDFLEGHTLVMQLPKSDGVVIQSF